jgi:hypothetical protein
MLFYAIEKYRDGVEHMGEKEDKKQVDITAHEENLLKLIRGLGFGEMIVHVVDGQPIRAEEIKKSVKL